MVVRLGYAIKDVTISKVEQDRRFVSATYKQGAL